MLDSAVASPIYICVREPTDWEELWHPIADLRSRAEAWDQTFMISFRDFRRRLAEIARLNFSRVENAIFATWDEIPDGGLVAPVDDDDWFAPDLGTTLADAYDPDATGYHWTSSVIEVPINLGHRLYLLRRRLFPWLRPMWICTTNNYAMVKSAETEPLLMSHVRASEWYGGEGAGRVKRIEGRLGIQNRTLAGYTSFHRTNLGRPKASVTRSELIRKYVRYRKLYAGLELAELAWARPYIGMMSDLMAELKIRDPSP
jgi:hypothetical protein